MLSGQSGGSADSAPMCAFVVEARNVIVGLRVEVRRDQAPLGGGREERQPPALREIADQRRDENRLAGARQAGDAEAQRGREQVREKLTGFGKTVGECLRKVARGQGNLIRGSP